MAIEEFMEESSLVQESFKYLGYPSFCVNALLIFKVLGALSAMISLVNKRIKDWAYAGVAVGFFAKALKIKQ